MMKQSVTFAKPRQAESPRRTGAEDDLARILGRAPKSKPGDSDAKPVEPGRLGTLWASLMRVRPFAMLCFGYFITAAGLATLTVEIMTGLQSGAWHFATLGMLWPGPVRPGPGMPWLLQSLIDMFVRLPFAGFALILGLGLVVQGLRKIADR